MFATVGICVALAGAPAEVDARQFVDQVRRQHGLKAVRLNSALQKAAQAHVEYMRLNNTSGHGQHPGDDGYTGSSPGERARRFGYNGANSEAVAWGNVGAASLLQGLFDAPYHRVLFLQPGAPDFGAATNGRAVCVKFGGEPGDGAVVSPPNGARSVPIAWDGEERPNPLRKTNLRGPVGYPVVLAVFGSESDGFRHINATLTGPGGRVDAIVLHPGSDEHAEGAVIIVPKRPLKRAASYTATFNYRNKGGERTVRAAFST